MSQYGEMMPHAEALNRFIAKWYNSELYGDTPAVTEFAARGAAKAIKVASGRMIDDVNAMLEAYQRDQQGPHGSNSKLPVMFVATSRDFVNTLGDWGGRQIPRQMIAFTRERNASMYGMRQAMHDVRAQFVILAPERWSASSIAAQLSNYLGNQDNRTFMATHTFGQYTIEVPIQIENPDVQFMTAGESKNMTALVCDITLKVTTPFFDAPKPGEPNDGSSNNPPGYPRVTSVDVVDENVRDQMGVTDDGIDRSPAP
ncbi:MULTISPECIES: hypothetical protein [Pseudomonas]|uniref:Uncharacterized protein n=1 Tax=Pseudomonas lutea TaxID=243924 RepID=A0A9X8MH15_9PSED|nr:MULTISPECIES: hypothetical protein [Pseudomonas]SER35765.1 hypothetical protein SAMN05216409_11824 [Pseudomonas lutea]